MKPIRISSSDVVYRGPTPEIGDLWCERIHPGCISSVWRPDDEERATIAAGGSIELVLWSEPIPPISLGVIAAADSEPIGDHPFKISGPAAGEDAADDRGR